MLRPDRRPTGLLHDVTNELERYEVPATPVGVTCRLCERTDCEQRAFPSLRHPLQVDENVRGVSLYSPAGPALRVFP